MPPSERMKPQTTKEATGPFNRRKLMAFLEKKAKEEKDWEIPVPYVKKVVGKGSCFNPLPDNKILDWSKLKQIADRILMCI